MADEQVADKPEVKDEGAPEQATPFENKMKNIQNALGGIDNQNVFDQGEKESSFNIDDKGLKDPPVKEEKPGDKSEEVSKEDEKPKESAEAEPVEKTTPVDGKKASAEEPAKSDDKEEGKTTTVTSRITGEVELKPEEVKNEETSVGFETWEDFDKWSEDGGHGITKENIKQELPKLVEAKGSLEASNKKIDDFNAVFENMPTELFKAIQVWNTGEANWRDGIKNSDSTDFKLDFDKHDSKSMVDKYYPNEITADDWSEFKDKETGDEDAKAKVQNHIDFAQKKYELDQQTFKQEIATYETNAKQNLELQQNAFNKSRENMPGLFEDTILTVDDNYISEVDKVAQTQASVLGIFYNPDGTLKPDAHQRIAMAMDGKGLVKEQANKLVKQIASKARQEVIEEIPDSQTIKKTSDQGGDTELEQSKKKVAEHINALFPADDTNTYS